MIATPELRWVERTVKRDLMDGNRVVIKDSVVTGHVLQQKWVKMVYNDYGVAHATDVFEWRDVPTEKES